MSSCIAIRRLAVSITIDKSWCKIFASERSNQSSTSINRHKRARGEDAREHYLPYISYLSDSQAAEVWSSNRVKDHNFRLYPQCKSSNRTSAPESDSMRMSGHRTQILPSCAWRAININSVIGPKLRLFAYGTPSNRSSDPNSAFLCMAGHQHQLGHRTQILPFCAWHAINLVIGPKFRLPAHGRSSDTNSDLANMLTYRIGHRTQLPTSSIP